jgi:hypothetical protein
VFDKPTDTERADVEPWLLQREILDLIASGLSQEIVLALGRRSGKTSLEEIARLRGTLEVLEETVRREVEAKGRNDNVTPRYKDEAEEGT